MIQEPKDLPLDSLNMPIEAFRGPIQYRPTQEWAPTPLDSYATNVETGAPITVKLGVSLEDRAVEAAKLYALPSDLEFIMTNELLKAQSGRCEKNRVSFERLLRQIEGVTLDDAMVQIIEKARGSAADPQELLRLIKEYPNMISVEFFKSHAMLDGKKYELIAKQLVGLIHALRQSFRDADVHISSAEERRASCVWAITDDDILIWREKIAEARSADAYIEVMAKNSMLLLPEEFTSPYPFMVATVSGIERKLLPLATSAYYRTGDYQKRLTGISGTAQQLGARATKNDPISAKLPPDMRDIYLRALGTDPSE